MLCDLSEQSGGSRQAREEERVLLPPLPLLPWNPSSGARGGSQRARNPEMPPEHKARYRRAESRSVRGKQNPTPQHRHVTFPLLNPQHLASAESCLIERLLLASQWLFFLICIVAMHLPASRAHRKGMVYIYLRCPKRT